VKPYLGMYVGFLLFLLGGVILFWGIGVKATAGIFVGAVAALLLRPYFKKLHANHTFDFLEHRHPRWALLLCLLLCLAVLLPVSVLMGWIFGEHGAEQVMIGAFCGACAALIVRPSFVRHSPTKQ
jgi:O-antigen/teichoic acid export membrane protein